MWSWFSSDALGKKYADDVRLELLRSTYRMPREQHAALYGIVDEIRAAFGIEATATLYQAQEDVRPDDRGRFAGTRHRGRRCARHVGTVATGTRANAERIVQE